MRFGIWVEPEMVNPDSDLYRTHPDWVLHMPNRARTTLRNQLVLNFARPDVVSWAHKWLDALVGTTTIDYLKWDMNRAFTEAGWPDAGPDASRLWIEHVRGVYGIIDRLRDDHPHLRIQACAGGGGRSDLGMLSRTDEVWISDNTDAADRVAIQHGYSQLYPARTMAAWVTDSPNFLTGRRLPLRFPLPRRDGRSARDRRQPAWTGPKRNSARPPTSSAGTSGSAQSSSTAGSTASAPTPAVPPSSTAPRTRSWSWPGNSLPARAVPPCRSA